MKTRFCIALAMIGGAGTAWPQTCPTPISPPPCLNLALGQVALLDVHPGTDFCIASQAADSEYTMMPLNYSPVSDVNPTFTANNVIAVVGPPAPLQEPMPPQLGVLEANSETDVASDAVAAPEPLPEFALPGRQERLIRAGRPNQALTIGDRFQVQVALGCNGTANMRLAEVAAEGTLGAHNLRLIIAHEVIESPPGVFTRYPVGGFTSADYAAFLSAWEQDPPGSTGASPAPTFLRGDAHDVLLANYGDVSDVDNNDSVIVFVTSWMNQISPPASSLVVNARFLARDLLDPSSCPLSNGREIIYALAPDPTGQVNSNVRTVSSVASNMLRSIAMQMVRMINAGKRLYVTSAPLEEPWLDGALAWTVGDLLFHRASMGLPPGGNIALSSLTTGPNASQRVAAFNTFINPSFGMYRNWLQQSSSNAAAFRFSPLQPNPLITGVPPLALPEEMASIYHGMTSVFLRYALDRANLGDAVMLQLLLDSGLTGKANLDAVIGADSRDWVRDFVVASYADDAIPATVMPAPYQNPSWNYRSVFGGLGGFPLGANALSNGVGFASAYDVLGGARWLRFGIPASGPSAAITSAAGGTATMTPMRVAVVRTK